MNIGQRARRLRLQAGLTQQELANRADLTKGFISQFENDATSPSISTLKDLLDALGTTLEEFFTGTAGDDKVVFRNEDRVISGESEEGYTLTFPIPKAHLHEMEPVLVELEPGKTTDSMSGHEGEEFGFVLQGRIALHVGDQRHTLRNGECFYFRADTEHGLANPGKRRAIVLWVACPPSF